MDAVPAPKCLQLNIYLRSKLLLNPTYYMGADETVQDKVNQYAVVMTFFLTPFIKYIYAQGCILALYMQKGPNTTTLCTS